jgi:hypothetical protein
LLRAIISAIVNALRSGARFLGRAAAFPLRLINGLSGGGGDVPELPEPEPCRDPENTSVDNQAVYREIVLAVMRWAAESIVADRPEPVPPRLPRPVQEWLPGLSRDECWRLMNASERDISAHMQGLFAIDAVPKVRPLQAKEWPPEPAVPAAVGHPSFSAYCAPAGP